MLGSTNNLTNLPRSSDKISIDQKARYIFFLQTTTFNTSDIGAKLWTYKINYKNGTSDEVPVLSLTDVGDWELWSQAGWQYILEGKKVYIMAVQTNKEDLIENIEINSSATNEVPVILAITIGV
jgi:hypothetical protein